MFDSGPLIARNFDNFRAGRFKDTQWLRSASAFDTETEGLDGALTLAGFWPIGNGAHGEYGKGCTVTTFQNLPPIPLIMHNMMHELHVLHRSKLPTPKETVFDIWAMAWLLDENRSNGLKPLGKDILGREWGVWRKDMTTEELTAYNLGDVQATYELFPVLWARLEKEGLLRDFLGIEINILPLLVEIECRGFRVDVDLLQQRMAEHEPAMEAARRRMRELLPQAPWLCARCDGTGIFKPKRGEPRPCVGCEGTGENQKFLNSSQQLGQVIFGELGHKPIVFTKKRNPSLTEEAIEKLLRVRDEPFLGELVRYRGLAKEYGTYYLPYWEEHLKNGRIHTELYPYLVTGRFSSSNPNLQNLPPPVRNVFIPDEGKLLLSADYVQLELYIMGLLSGEQKIINAYENNEDLHQRTAGIVGRDRDVGKTINYALPYGLSVGSLAGRLNVSKTEAQSLYDEIVGGYSDLFEFFKRVKRSARDTGFVTTILNRRRRISGLDSRNGEIRFHAENQTINSRIQGSAADLAKAAMIKLKRELPEVEQVLQVHDEIDGQANAKDAKDLAHEMKRVMETAIPFIINIHGEEVPFKPKVEVKIQDRWKK